MANQVSLKLAMVKRWFKILTGSSATAVKQGRGKYFDTKSVKGYYNDLTKKVGEGTSLDNEGIPVSKISDGSEVNFPIAVFQYALALYDMFIETGDVKYKTDFFTQISWIMEHQRKDGSWDCFGPLKSDKYTVSSMGQGEGASALLRAYTQTQDNSYLAVAKKAIDFMLTPMEKGGTAFYNNDELYLEEYPQTPRRSVLNGWIFSSFGLYDLSLYMPEYSEKFIDTAKTIAAHLDNYDNGYWSLYDLERRVASPAYHELHIALLEVMYELSGIAEFKIYAEKFSKYQRKKGNKYRAIGKKFAQKITEHSDSVIVK